MKHRIFSRSICIVLCGAMLLSLIGCQSKETAKNQSSGNETVKIEPMEVEEVDVVGFDFLGGTNVMPIGGFYGPMPSSKSINGIAMPDYITDEYFKMIADCGVNLITYSLTNYNKTPEYAIKMLELGEKYGVGITVTDGGISTKKEDLTLEKVDENVNEYIDYPAFCGVYVIDEPGSATYPGPSGILISEVARKMNLLGELGVWTYGNLLPCYNASYRDKYEDYVEEWLSTCDAKMLLWDHYVHDEGVQKIDYFYSLSFGREKAAKYDIPFWVFIQAGTHWTAGSHREDTEDYYPNEAQFMWNVNTSLAYGAKGLAYFPLLQPDYFAPAASKPYDFERNGLIGASGNKNRWWYYAQNMNKQVAAVDEVLMNSVNKGVIVTSDQAKKDNADSSCIIEGKAWRELTNIKGETMVGCFNYKGKSAYYVVNYNMEYAQHITLEFYDDCNFTVIQNAETSKLQGNGIELTMDPGEGVLVVME